jgi:hypothetical protein
VIEAGILNLTDAEGSLLSRHTEALTAAEAQLLRGAAKILRTRRFRMTVRCDACFEAGRGDGMRGEINSRQIHLECRCRFLTFDGATL